MRRCRQWTSCGLLGALLLGLVAAGCGGGGGGTGVTVTVTPKTATVSLNGTLQFFANVTGGTVAAATIASSSGAVRSANVVTITTTSPHGLSTGQTVTISGVSDSSFNGTFVIATVPSTTIFTYAQAGPDATSGGGTVSTSAVKWFVNGVESGNTTSGTISTTGLFTAPANVPPATTLTIASNGAVRSNNVVTVTTTAAHNLLVGQVMTISGVTDTSFNGTFSIQTVPSSTTFTFSQTASNATSGGGTVTSTAVQIKAQAVADSTKSDTATVSVDSGIRIRVSPSTATVGTGETLPFTATVTCLVSPCNTSVDWTLSNTSTGGSIDANGKYTAPATAPSPATVNVTATSQADTSRTGTATVTVVTAADPTLTTIHPSTAAQGSLFQDLYLDGTNFLSTSTVLVNGITPVPATAISGTLLRARITDSVLATQTAPTPLCPTPLCVQVKRQNGTTSSAQTLTVVPVRPALVGASPDSATQGSAAAVSFNVNGGFFGTTSSPAVTAEFDGSGRTASVCSPTNPDCATTAERQDRQLKVTIGGPTQTGDLATPGLVSVAVRNSAATSLAAVTNFAVQPCLDSTQSCAPVTPPSVVATLTVGTKPGAVAVNTATGMAVVANHDSNDITLIALTPAAPAVCTSPVTSFPGVCVASVPVGMGPTGVAVDNVRNLAVVANNGDNTVSVVNLATQAVIKTLGSSDNIFRQPFSVGVNPLTGRAVVAYQSTNIATIIDLDAKTVIGAVSASTGTAPQVSVEPRLNWAIITPGGAGTLSIVDLGRQTTNAIAGAPNGAVRASNVVTITTTTAHGLSVGQGVLVTGVTGGTVSFNGYFTVASVPSPTSFTYAQTGPAENGGGGSILYANALATVTLGTGVRGIAINPETEKALLTDATSSLLVFFSVLDQTVSTLTLAEAGATAAAVNPLTDIGVTVNPNTDRASIIDPRTPACLTCSTGNIPVGTGPKAVAIDPGSNLAIVANETSNNVSIVSLGSIRSPQITQINPPTTLNSAADLPVTMVGKGFTASSTVRLDGTALLAGNVSFVSDRRLDVMVPASFLGTARRYALDVVDGTSHSNAQDFTVMQSVHVSSGCTPPATPAPRAVAIDAERNLALVTNTGCNNISLIDIDMNSTTFGTVKNTIGVGTNPQGVAVISRLGKAVVTNRGSNNASIVDVVGGTVTSTVTVGTEPIGVAINQDTGSAIVANSASNTISIFDASAGGTPTNVSVDQHPIAVAIDPNRKLAVVANAAQNNLTLVDLSQSTPAVTNRISITLPTAVVFDPVTGFFLATASLANNFFIINPDTLQATPVRVGINPTSLAYNFESSTLVTVNTASNTVSVMDFLDRRVRAILGLTGSQQFSVDIHPRTNLAVIADENNNRVLLVPLPR